MITSPKRNIPKVPYRKITEAEKEEIYAYFKGDNKINDDYFWQQTQEEARKVIRTIKKGGFIVGGELLWGDSTDGFGVHSHVYPRNYTNKNIEKHCDYDRVIGSVDLWEGWGFVSNPVKIWYENPEILDDSFELRNYLIASGISFKDSVNLQRLKKQISKLEAKRLDNLKILNRFKGIELRE